MMAAHRPHPIEGEWPSDSGRKLADPADAVLYDDCDRCGEQAANLRGLDESKLKRLYNRMLEVETGDRDTYATATEGRAAATLVHALEVTSRLFPTAFDPYQYRQPHTLTRMKRKEDG